MVTSRIWFTPASHAHRKESPDCVRRRAPGDIFAAASAYISLLTANRRLGFPSLAEINATIG